jgi:hypothetical protein
MRHAVTFALVAFALTTSLGCPNVFPVSNPNDARIYSTAFIPPVQATLVPSSGPPQKTATLPASLTITQAGHAGTTLGTISNVTITVLGDATDANAVAAVAIGGALISNGYYPNAALSCQHLSAQLLNSAGTPLYGAELGPFAPKCGQQIQLAQDLPGPYRFQYQQVQAAALTLDSCQWLKCP